MQWTAAEFAVDETLSVRVLDVVNPGLLYVVPIQLKGGIQSTQCCLMYLFCLTWNE